MKCFWIYLEDQTVCYTISKQNAKNRLKLVLTVNLQIIQNSASCDDFKTLVVGSHTIANNPKDGFL